MSKPRIFVSSTYYDLKYVRERIERFINTYCFEPILFENDGVYFNPNKSLDTSCYNEVSNCHMMILIVGGRYGSLASDDDKDQTKDDYEKQYVSITHKEYTTAISKGIPVMIFIEQNVYTEYKTYQTNKKLLPKNFKFAYVDDVRVFHFIALLEQSAIKQFNKVEDIEHYFANQISGMLLSYLNQLQMEKTSLGIENAVEQLNRTNEQIQNMVNSIAEKVLSKDKAKYEDLLQQQNKSLIDFFIAIFEQTTIWADKPKDSASHSNKICQILMSSLFEERRIERIIQGDGLTRFKALRTLGQECSEQIKQECNIKVIISPYRFSEHLFKIVKLIHHNEELKQYFETKLNEMLYMNLSLPF